MANDFFKNGDKAYSENLNDGLLVGNAFDWTVDVSLPSDTGGVFPNSSTIVKAKMADVSITPNSNLSIGSTIENNSSSSQVYRLTVYPNFNRYGGFKSISLTADSGVTFYIANKGGTSPIASNLDYDDLSNVPELKVLKEYDIVLTIPNGKSVSGLEFVFQSSSADVSGSITQANVSGLEDDITRIDNKDSAQDIRLTALESSDAHIFHYELTASKYTPLVSESVTFTCHCTDVNDDNVSGKSLTLKWNGNTVSTNSTNSDGIATWTINGFSTNLGLQRFSVNGVECTINVRGWRLISSADITDYQIYENGDRRIKIIFNYDTVSLTTTWTTLSQSAIGDTTKRPPTDVVVVGHYGNYVIRVNTSGSIMARTITGTATTAIYGYMEYSY